MRRWVRILLNATTLLSVALLVSNAALSMMSETAAEGYFWYTTADGNAFYLHYRGRYTFGKLWSVRRPVTGWTYGRYGLVAVPGGRAAYNASLRASDLLVTDGREEYVVHERDVLHVSYVQAMVVALVPSYWAWRWWGLRRSARMAGRCPACGYDLRATPERCPECGTVAAGA